MANSHGLSKSGSSNEDEMPETRGLSDGCTASRQTDAHAHAPAVHTCLDGHGMALLTRTAPQHSLLLTQLPEELVLHILVLLIDHDGVGWPDFRSVFHWAQCCSMCRAHGVRIRQRQTLPESLHWTFGSARERPLLLKNPPVFVSMQLSNVGMRDAGLVRLVSALREEHSLFLLDVSYNEFGLLGTSTLLDALKEPTFLPSLTVLIAWGSCAAFDGLETEEEQDTALHAQLACFEEFSRSDRGRGMKFLSWSEVGAD